MMKHAWYDTYKLPPKKVGKTNEEMWANINQDDLTEIAKMILKIAEQEADILGDPGKVFIGGFSQGSIVALAAFLHYKGTKPLGGFIVLSGRQLLDYPNQVKFDDKKQEEAIA